jgi:hypothetical protein
MNDATTANVPVGWAGALPWYEPQHDPRQERETDGGDHHETDHVAGAGVVSQVCDRHPDQQQRAGGAN